MPHIAITMFPGRTPEEKQALAEKTKELIMEELNVPAQVVSVSVEDIPKEDWAKSMEGFSDDDMYVKPQY